MCAPVPLIVDSLQELEIKFSLLNLLITDLRDSVSRAYSRPGVEDCVVPTGVVGLRHAQQILLVLGIGFPAHSTDLGQSTSCGLSYLLYISSYLRHVPILYWTEVRFEDSEHPGTGIQVGLKQFPSLQSLVRSTWMLNILTDLICTPKLLPMSR